MEIATLSPTLSQPATAAQRAALATLARQFPIPDNGAPQNATSVRQWVVALATQWLSPHFEAPRPAINGQYSDNSLPSLPLTRALALLEQLDQQVRHWAAALKHDAQKTLLLRALTSIVSALRSHLEDVAYTEKSSRRGRRADSEARSDLHGIGNTVPHARKRRTARKKRRRYSTNDAETPSDTILGTPPQDDACDALLVDLPSVMEWLQQQRTRNDYAELGTSSHADGREHLLIDESA
ncbi:MAG: hypothetical protein AAF290_09850 [Pseudomonadota bacterium]